MRLCSSKQSNSSESKHRTPRRRRFGWKLVPILLIPVFSFSCATMFLAPKDTTISLKNNLTEINVEINGTATDIAGVNLVSIIIGDVYFPFVNYGTTSATKILHTSGDEVPISIDSAIVLINILGQISSVSFGDISPSSTIIMPGKHNTVVFNKTTAGTVFRAFAKKKREGLL